jgi:hypothetical protein
MRGGPGVLADLGLDPGDHVCGFYNGSNIRDELTAAWVSEGVAAGQKCVCFVDSSAALLGRLADDLALPDTPGGAVGRVEFCDADAAYAPGGRFCKDAMLRRLEDSVTGAMGEGYSQVRLLGDMSWVIRNGVDTKTVFAYEAEVNEFCPRYPQFVLCLYDLDHFDGSLVIDVLRTHPKIILNGMFIHNPYYLPPAEVVLTS